MKYLGTKFIGTDSSIFVIDTEKRQIFAISTERVTRNKHDPFDITPIFSEVETLKNTSFKIVSVPFNDFRNQDFSLPTKFICFLIFLYSFFKKRKKTVNAKNNWKQVNHIHNKSMVIKLVQNLSIAFRPLNFFFVKLTLRSLLFSSRVSYKDLQFFDHHLCHVASSYYLSDIESKSLTLGISIDGFGDGFWIKSFSIRNGDFKLIGKGSVRRVWNKTHFVCPSLGEVYGNFTEVLGYKRNSDEGKVEALAAFGEADKELISILDSSFKIEPVNIYIQKNPELKFYENNFKRKKLRQI